MAALLIGLGIVVLVVLAWWIAQLGTGRGADASAVPRSEAGVRALLERGQKLDAIKLLREVSGLGLKESKEAVDELERGGRLPPVAPPPAVALPPENDPTFDRLIAAGQVIEAIKRYRELSGAGLLEAKEAVDRLVRARDRASG